MKNLTLILAILLLSAAPAVHAVGGSGVVVTYSETLEDLSLSAEATRNLAAGRAFETTLVFNALGQRFEVALEPNEPLLAGTGRKASDLGVYRGRLVGKPGSWARIAISKGIPTGLIWDGAEMLAVEAQPGNGSAAIYRLKDTYVEPEAMSCGTPGKESSLEIAYAAVTKELEAVISSAPGAVEEIRLGLVGDYEFTTRMGNDVDIEILRRMNNVDGIFSEQLGVQITVDVIETFSSPNDPFTTSVPDALLNELAGYRESTPAQNVQGLTHMFTGRDLDNTTVGVAYQRALCDRRFGVGLSEGRRGVVTDSLIAAHEIGHNFGAEHDGEAGSVCESVTGDFLMSPRVSNTDQFSSCSINTMRPRADAARCINPLAQTDVSIALSNAPSNLLLGASTDLVYDVTNAGSGNATNVSVSFSLPTNLAIDSFATTVGSCTSGGGQVNCTIGTLSAGGSASVALSLTASSVGSDTLDASVAADGDADLDDNSQSVPIVVIPATDLRVVNTASRSVALDSSFSISPGIDNVSALVASNLSLSVTFSAGLRVNGASWPNGMCSVGSDSVTCQRADLAAGTSVSLDVQVTATGAGAQSYTATVSSSEADANTSDNSASATVSVTGGGGDSGSGGGGAFGLLWLFLTTMADFVARLRRP